MNILVINGPNLNLLGVREPDLYGKQDYTALVALVEETCAQEGMEVEVFQSNHEGAIVDRIQAALGTADGIVINPAAYTHTSVAILDALKAVNLPAVEVHISDVSQREDFRQVSYAGMACVQTYMGLGLEGYRKAILFLTFGISTGMVIWVGDPNLLYVFPLFVFFSMLSTQGDWMGRLAVTIIFFCIIMSVCAILDTYIALFDLFTIDTSDFLCRLMRPLFFALLYLLIRRRMPVGVISLSRRLWKLILGLSFMPLCALMAVVLLTYRKWDSMVANSMAMNQGMVVLPFTGVTALILLFVILTLANHEKLEQEVHLAGLREVYYQGIQREQVQVRTLRHDLRNHMTVLRGLLESGETEKAIGYLEQITDSSSLGGGKPFSDNETANVVLTAKAKEMRMNGRDVISFSVGEPDFITPQYIRTAAHEALDMGLTKYTPAAGTLGLRRAICEKLRWDNGLEYSPSQVIVSNGAKFSIYASLAAIVNPGDEVLIPTPCWVSYPEIVRIVGGVPVLVQGDAKKGFVTEAEDLAPYVTERTKALILNSPNNPNGCIWNREQLTDIAKLAVEKGFYVVSDEIYEKLIADCALTPERTLFIDDTLPNVEGAMKLGINGFHMHEKGMMDRFFL